MRMTVGYGSLVNYLIWALSSEEHLLPLTYTCAQSLVTIATPSASLLLCVMLRHLPEKAAQSRISHAF